MSVIIGVLRGRAIRAPRAPADSVYHSPQLLRNVFSRRFAAPGRCFATFLVIVHCLLDTVVHCLPLLRNVCSRRFAAPGRCFATFLVIILLLCRSYFIHRAWVDLQEPCPKCHTFLSVGWEKTIVFGQILLRSDGSTELSADNTAFSPR